MTNEATPNAEILSATGTTTIAEMLGKLQDLADARRATLAEAKILARFESELSDSSGRRVQYHNGPDAGHGYPG